MNQPLLSLLNWLERATRASHKAKNRPGQMKKQYARKCEAIDCATRLADAADVVWGWKANPKPKGDYDQWTVYFELTTGQISFHSPKRGTGPDYSGEWDGAVLQNFRRIDDAKKALYE